MNYIKVNWIHALSDSPTVLFHEINDDGWEIRKVEVFSDGRIGFADAVETTPLTKTRLSIVQFPTLDEIAFDPQFHPTEITKDEFEAIWSRRKLA